MTSNQNIQSLFSNAQDQGMSSNATSILVNNLNGTTIAGAQGASVDDLAGDQVTLFVKIIDMTGSMDGFRQTVIDAYNQQLKDLSNSKAAESILMSTWLFNTRSKLRHGYQPLTDVPPLDWDSYNPDHQTALYDAILDAFTGVVAYGQSLRDAGVNTKIVVSVHTDGADNASRSGPVHVATVAQELLKQEIYTLALVAYGVDGYAIAKAIGFPAENVLNANSTPHDVRKAYGTESKSVIRASQTVIGKQGSQNFFS
jgi:hypothetical protein